MDTSHIIGYIIIWGDAMAGFQVSKQEYVNKTFRLPLNLVNDLSKLAQEKNISLTQLVIKCCEFALENLQEDKP